MSAARGVTADELVRALKRRRAALPAEIGTFVVLETCEVLVTRGACGVSLANVYLTDEGLVRIEGAGSTDEEGASRALHGMLTSLLVAAGPAPTPALMRLVEEGPEGGSWTLAQMRDDLEASLVPLNRLASRRVLARLVREAASHDRVSLRPEEPDSYRELDAELSSLLGIEPEQEQELVEAGPPSARERDATIVDQVDDVDERDEVLLFGDRADATGEESVRTLNAPSSQLAGRGALRELDGLDRPERTSSRGLWWGLALVVLAAALAGATMVMRPDVLAKLTGEAPLKVDALAAPEPPPPVRGGDLVVHVWPERAQVLRFVGRGPVTVKNLPLGVAHEFVAFGDGVAPTRVVVSKDAEWEKTPEGSQYELAMQLGRQVSPTAPLDLGPSSLPEDVGRPSSGLGSVRIVTTPRGAKVYQLVGFAPEVRVEGLSAEQTEELLVYQPGFAHVVRVVSPSDFVLAGGHRTADVRIRLSALKRK